MQVSEIEILNECLKFFIDNKKRHYSLNEIYVKNANVQQIRSVLCRISNFFQLLDFNNQTIIKIAINVQPCKDYNSFRVHCNQKECQFLHICRDRFYKGKCLRGKCKLLHYYKDPRNVKKLNDMNIIADVDLVFKFIKTFNVENDDKSEKSIGTARSNKQDNLELRIKIPKNFVQEGNENILRDVFSSEFKSGGGEITKLKYLPDQFKAYIRYKDDSIAEKLSNIRNINYLKYHFEVFKVSNKKNEEIKTDNTPYLFQEIMPVQHYENNQSHFYLKKIPKEKTESEILKFSALISLEVPKSIFLIDSERGVWLINFDKSLDMTKIKNKFNESKQRISPNIEIDTVYNAFQSDERNMNSFKSLKSEEKFTLEKKLENNELLQVILKERNTIWKNELKEKIEKINASISSDANSLIISASKNPTINLASWQKDVNGILKQFFRDFAIKTLNFDKTHIEAIFDLKKSIEQTRKLYLIDYSENLLESKINIMAKKVHMKDFFEKFPHFESLFTNLNSETHEQKKSNSNYDDKSDFLKKFSAVSKSIAVPMITYSSHKDLIDLVLKIIKTKYNLDDYFIRSTLNKDANLIITGTVQNVNKSFDILNRVFKNIKVKSFDGFDVKLFNYCKNLPQIVEDLFVQNESLFKVNVKMFDSNELPGFYISYLTNIPEFDCENDSIFEKASKFLKENLTLKEIDATRFSHLITSEKWKSFENENINKIMEKNFWFTKVPNMNRQTLIIISGKKYYVDIVSLKIENFFSINDSKSKEILITKEDANFLRLTAVEHIKKIEAKFDIKIDINDIDKDKSKIIVKDYPVELFTSIDNELKNLIKSKQEKVYSTQDMVGIDKLINEKNNILYHSIKNIETDTMTIISIENPDKMNEKNKEKKEIDPNQSNIKKNCNFFGNSSSNRVTRTLKVGNSEINLEVGSIIHTKADVIVNTTTNSLNLRQGILSKSILESAGDSIQDECSSIYPNGINPNMIAVTSAGQIKGIKFIYHIALPRFKEQIKAQNDLGCFIIKTIDKLKLQNLNQISYPALGTGGFGYPNDLVAKTTLNTLFDILENESINKKFFKTNIVVYEKDTKVIQDFENMFDSFESKKTSSGNKELKNITNKINIYKSKSQAKFIISYKNLIDFNKASSAINKLINEELFAKEIINEANMENITSLTEIDLQNLINKYPDIEITYENKILTLFGIKNEIALAKVELTQAIYKKVANQLSKMKEQFKISKDIQWQFESNSQWKSFSVFHNSLIESSYRKKEANLTFVNENNENCTINFSNTPIVCIVGHNTINIRRLDTTKLDNELISFPQNWTNSNSQNDFDLFDLVQNSIEYQTVKNDFVQKFQNPNVIIRKIQRVQNQYLYKQYSNHRQKYQKEKRQLNEMDLFHGSSEDSLLKICRFGFNRSYCGVNGVAYGQGVYFAKNSSYSKSYSVKNQQGLFCMIRAKVVVGQCCVGNPSMRTPPEQNGLNIPYDSTADPSGSIFVCYHDNQCYPEYLIYFN